MHGTGARLSDLKEHVDTATKNTHPDGLVDLEARTRDSVLTVDFVSRLMVGKYKNTYRDAPFLKDAVSQHVYLQLIAKLTPGTIIDLGTAFGGSSMWFSHNSTAAIVTMDIEDVRSPGCKADPRIQFFKQDISNGEQLATLLRDCPRPWLVCEDCHLHAKDVMRVFDPLLRSGDYIVFEDTHPFNPNTCGMSAETDVYEHSVWSTAKLQLVEEEMLQRPEYKIDAEVQDFYGYNGCTFINSVFCKT